MKIIEVTKNIKIPGTNVILEKGDKIHILNKNESVLSGKELFGFIGELQKYLDDNKLFVSECYVTRDNRIAVGIEWGDWKHDHLRLDLLLEKFFNAKNLRCEIDEQITDEDGSDAYSAIHYCRVMR